MVDLIVKLSDDINSPGLIFIRNYFATKKNLQRKQRTCHPPSIRRMYPLVSFELIQSLHSALPVIRYPTFSPVMKKIRSVYAHVAQQQSRNKSSCSHQIRCAVRQVCTLKLIHFFTCVSDIILRGDVINGGHVSLFFLISTRGSIIVNNILLAECRIIRVVLLKRKINEFF